MNWLLVLAFLFAAGALIGWVLEFFFRNLISHKGPKGRIFINPGFCRGPYLPIYGVGLAVMFVISYFLTPDVGTASMVLIVLGIGLCMTLIELVGGFFLLKVMNIRLWDYRHFKGNIGGFICPQFSLIWTALGALYYLVVHPLAINGIIWLSQNLAFSFMIGLFFGLFATDMAASGKEALIIREFGQDQEVVIKYEELKALMQQRRMENRKEQRFFHQLGVIEGDLKEVLAESAEVMEKKLKIRRK